MIKIYETLKRIKENKFKDIQTPTHSTLFLSDNDIELEINGIPSSILISFSGTGSFLKKMPIDIKVKIGKGTILISNTFLKEIPRLLFSYLGNIKVYDCQIMNFDTSKIRAEVKNNQIEDIISQSKTNMEDDTLIIREDVEIVNKKMPSSGLINPILDKSIFDDYGKIQKYGKRDVEKLSATIRQFIPLRVESSTKVRTPDVSRPTVSKPTVFEPVVTAPKIKKKGGRY